MKITIKITNTKEKGVVYVSPYAVECNDKAVSKARESGIDIADLITLQGDEWIEAVTKRVDALKFFTLDEDDIKLASELDPRASEGARLVNCLAIGIALRAIGVEKSAMPTTLSRLIVTMFLFGEINIYQ